LLMLRKPSICQGTLEHRDMATVLVTDLCLGECFIEGRAGRTTNLRTVREGIASTYKRHTERL
jgi:hypothetical protein